MPDSTNQLRVWLRTPTTESAFFLGDVRIRLEAVARCAGAHIEWSNTDSPSELTAALSPSASSALREEVGTHRAQYVPSNSEGVAIVTAFVEVQITGSSTAGDVVRNYNYPLRHCKSFRSGQVQSLDDVLAGAG